MAHNRLHTWGQLSLILLLAVVIVSMSGCSWYRKKGGYYQNDGPGNPSVMTPDKFKDAEPRVEPLLSGPNKPYTALGKRYVPDTREVPYRKKGVASWYGKQYHGRQTSSGEVFDMYAMTAAHTTLPIPCYVKVTHTKNGRSVIVRVNDRGPFSDKRIIDLSYGAAYRLDMINSGTAEVVVERIMPADIKAGKVPDATTSTPLPSTTANDSLSGGYYIQIGAYSEQPNAQEMRDRVSAGNRGISPKLLMQGSGGIYRLYAGPYSSESEATKVGNQIERQIGSRTLLLDRR